VHLPDLVVLPNKDVIRNLRLTPAVESDLDLSVFRSLVSLNIGRMIKVAPNGKLQNIILPDTTTELQIHGRGDLPAVDILRLLRDNPIASLGATNVSIMPTDIAGLKLNRYILGEGQIPPIRFSVPVPHRALFDETFLQEFLNWEAK
ncbi:MAG: hypothetical protein KDA89_05770, partial [Planctomycetaceae bacterium]|nr:hypothetical protein [Planctomycetaceae bacterium]